MQVLRTTFPLQTPNTNSFPNSLSSCNAISPLSILPKISLSLTLCRPPPSTLIRMGGGPRTYPGGVSKWQWKRMQAKKAQQLLKARLSRERQIYEMRKRAELKAAVSNLERPWEVVQKDSPRTSSSLFSVSADEQLKVLADRFQKPGGFDMWSDNDGPQLFHTHEGLPSARFFPKGVVHSIKPYGNLDGGMSREKPGLDPSRNRRSNVDNNSHSKDGSRKFNELRGDGSRRIDRNQGKDPKGGDENGRNLMKSGGVKEQRKTGSNPNPNPNSKRDKNKRGYHLRRGNLHGEDVYDMSLQRDGSYGFSGRKGDDKLIS
ncbi:uncharacterized protein LOC104899954 [Beta vulgaris subsp. vulgaris]|uniref:uncharacterized protein LOC104899954 n=1 Tax=Beta vulgaris subsp. vulgaris TaxID=3555 RepID=UPI0025486CA7|nr:uncharacterized protein LOC104899954 [Beta vulgaris subsp. vulgaris]